MIKYLGFFLQCATVFILGATAHYIYSLLKIVGLNVCVSDFHLEVTYDPPTSHAKRQKLIKCILTGNSQQYMGKAYTEEQINKLSVEEVDKLFSNYEAKLSGQMVKSMGKSIIKVYLMRACTVWGTTNQDALSEDLESDPFLNSALQRFTCKFYYRFGTFLAPLDI